MYHFENVTFQTNLHEEIYKKNLTIAYYTISNTPFTYEYWVTDLGYTFQTPIEDIYQHCADKLHSKEAKTIVSDSKNKLFIEPGMIEPFEKMASFYFLQLLATIHYKKIWKKWDKIQIPSSLLKDETFCLCLIALHPILYAKIHPIQRNAKRVCLEAIAGWNVPAFSILQFVHPYALSTYKGKQISFNAISKHIQPHTDNEYWTFNDTEIVQKVIGQPGNRKWYELQYAGPQAVQYIVQKRLSESKSLEMLTPYLHQNNYCK